jgi:hypothetical protein
MKMKKRIKIDEIEKPCHILRYCPYGPLVEDFPLEEEPTDYSCSDFGHDCPVYYAAEPFIDGEE